MSNKHKSNPPNTRFIFRSGHRLRSSNETRYSLRAGRQNCVENLQGDKNHLRRQTHVFVGRDIKKTFPRVFAYDALRQKLKVPGAHGGRSSGARYGCVIRARLLARSETTLPRRRRPRLLARRAHRLVRDVRQ